MGIFGDILLCVSKNVFLYKKKKIFYYIQALASVTSSLSEIVKFTLLPVLRTASEGEMQMLRSFDLKQNVNPHAFKERTFLPKSCKNEGKGEVINLQNNTTWTQSALEQNEMCFGGTSNLILAGLFHSHSTNKNLQLMEEESKHRSKCQDFNQNPKEPTGKCQTEKKVEWFETCT